MTRSLAAAVLVAALAAACGDDTPTAPTPVTPPPTTAPTVTGVTLQAPAAFVDGGQVLMVGESVTLEAWRDLQRRHRALRGGRNLVLVLTDRRDGLGKRRGHRGGAGETTISAVYERNTGRADGDRRSVDEVLGT